MSDYQRRLDRLEDALHPALPEPIRILRVIVAPDAPGDRVVSVVAANGDRTYTEFSREPGESTEALCERACQTMGWST